MSFYPIEPSASIKMAGAPFTWKTPVAMSEWALTVLLLEDAIEGFYSGTSGAKMFSPDFFGFEPNKEDQ